MTELEKSAGRDPILHWRQESRLPQQVAGEDAWMTRWISHQIHEVDGVSVSHLRALRHFRRTASHGHLLCAVHGIRSTGQFRESPAGIDNDGRIKRSNKWQMRYLDIAVMFDG